MRTCSAATSCCSAPPKCNLDEILTCRARNSHLPVIILTNLAFIFLAVTLLPVPSIIVFYLWTFGLTLGVLYMAYSFSPMCLPRVLTCLGVDLCDLVVAHVFPLTLALPAPLYNT